MKELLRHADAVPVTLVVGLAYVTLAIVTHGIQMHADSELLAAYGWLTPRAVAVGQWWRLLTSAFLHGGLLHLFFNLSMLLQIGPVLERSLGSLRFLLLYLVSALGGNVAVCLLYPELQPVLGGSGALFGMLGALVAMNMHGGRHAFAFLAFAGPRRLLGTIAANLVIGWLLPFVSNTAHVGGLLAGFGLAFCFLIAPRHARASRRHWQVVLTALLVSLLLAARYPVWRWDWLHHQAETAQGERRAALLAAFARAVHGPAFADLSPEQNELLFDEFSTMLREAEDLSDR